MTEQIKYPSQPIELGTRIEISKKLVQDLESYKLSRSEQNIIIGYVRNGQDFNLLIPTCPDYLPDDKISSKDSSIIGSNVPNMLFPLLQQTNQLYEILQKHTLPAKIQILIANPRYGGLDLKLIDNQQDLIQVAYEAQKESIQEFLIQNYPNLQFEIMDFGKKFGYQSISDLETKYIKILNELCEQNSGFCETIDRKIKADMSKMYVDYARSLKMDSTNTFIEFTTEQIIRGMAENLALGDLISKTELNPIIFSPNKRGNMTNKRNQVKLPEYGEIEQSTIPIISPNQ
jgi:hypothetical protein